MKQVYITFLLGFYLMIGSVHAQQTVGLFTYDTLAAYDGYTLFAPFNTKKTYLINNCGHLVNHWESDYQPGANCYLNDSGYLIRAGLVFSPFNEAGGAGGILEKYDWDGNLVWSYLLANDSFSQHHDFRIMPNGNILVLIWEKVSEADAIANGRDQALIMEGFIWTEKIIEIKPKGSDDADIVWEWNAMDHIIQDYDSKKENYGVVSEHPELLDFNSSLISNPHDWLHFNSVDYNATLDQIMISCHAFSEIYIIDHSTSSSQSSGHFGGNQNQGGDILYRYGNPQAYDRGNATDRVSFKQHDAHWIAKGLTGEGKVLFFNNGTERKYSSVEMFTPSVKPGTHTYLIEPNKPFQPSNSEWSYTENSSSFFSTNMGGVQRLPNGNTLVCESTKGRIFEFDKNDKIVWEYVCPIVAGGPIKQGNNAAGNQIFRALKYSVSADAFKNKNIVDGKPIELNYLYKFCDDTTSRQQPNDTTTHDTTHHDLVKLISTGGIKVYPNPVVNVLTIDNTYGRSVSWRLVTTTGQLVAEGKTTKTKETIAMDSLSSGLYFLELADPETGVIHSIRLQKE
ncbi:MAG: T9SS type A sorting domain-containing protein [Bacteroidetes bacterium]|nr:T9SS type A sorting domain-containing protein [Bacteroidota bacterium]